MAQPGFSIKFDARKFVKSGMDLANQKLPTAVRSALFIEAQQIITMAKKLTPVDEGILRASGHVQLPTVNGTKYEVRFGFGGPAGSGNQGESNKKEVGYAIYVHEDMTARHNVGQAKYLEIPFNERKSGMSERLAKRISSRLGMI